MQKYALIGLVALVVLGGGYYLTQNRVLPTEEVHTATSTTSGATSTPEKLKEDLSKYPEHELPAGARAIDQYFYIANNAVYLNSVTGTSSLKIPDAKAGSFKRITEFRSVPDPAIAIDCVKPGQYAYYADSQSVFMYQIWLNSKFRRSKFETLTGIKPEEFEVLSPSSFKGGDITYTLGYEMASSTCNYTIQKQP